MSSTNKTNYSYTKKEIDSMGGGSSLSDTISQKANKSDLSKYLPLSGGRLTGEVIARTVDDSLLQLRGASNYDRGAYLSVSGEGHSHPGEFYIVARTQTESSKMIGKPNGSLTWNDKNIETIEEQGDGYIRYANGLQVCFIQTSVPANTTTPLTLPKPFINTQYALSVVNHGGSSSNCVIGYGSKTITDFSIKNVDSSPLFVDVIGIGRWK